jgi:hypothetical protein
MSSRVQAGARADRRAKAARHFVLAGIAAGTIACASPLVGRAGALPNCGGNQSIKVAPVTCAGQRTIDGTTFSVVLDVRNDVVTATYTLDAPRAADTPIRVRSHHGISSQPNVAEMAGTIPAGATSASLTVALQCGQIDVKAVFTANGDARGRVTAPYVSNSTNCEAATTTTTSASTTTVATTTSTPGSPATTASSAPLQSTTTAAAGSATTVSQGHTGPLPVTGAGTTLAVLGAALVGVGVVLAAASRSRSLVE